MRLPSGTESREPRPAEAQGTATPAMPTAPHGPRQLQGFIFPGNLPPAPRSRSSRRGWEAGGSWAGARPGSTRRAEGVTTQRTGSLHEVGRAVLNSLVAPMGRNTIQPWARLLQQLPANTSREPTGIPARQRWPCLAATQTQTSDPG